MPYHDHLYYEEQGQGLPLVLLHGHTLDRRIWQAVLPLLSPGFRTILLDLPGHGKSGPSPGRGSLADEVAELLEQLGIERAAICGLSQGGAVAISFAINHPERCLGLIPIAAALNGHRFPSWAGPRPYILMARSVGLAPALEAWLADPLFATALASPRAKLVQAIVRQFKGGPWLTPTAAPPVVGRPEPERLRELATPTLVIVGAEDLPDFRQIADLLTAKIAGARLTVIEEAGHLVPVERPAALAQALIPFLNQLTQE